MSDSRSLPGLERVPGVQNWIERLPAGMRKAWHESYPYRIAKHLAAEKGFSVSHAIPAAINRTKMWASGAGNVSAEVQAKAAKDIALWNSMRAYAKSHKGSTVDNSNISWQQREVLLSNLLDLAQHTKQFGHKKGNLSKPADWSHGYNPKNPVSMAVKAKHLSKGDLTKDGKPKTGKEARVRMPVPPHLKVSKVDTEHQVGERANQGTARQTKAPAKPTTAIKRTSNATLKNRRNALQSKIAAGKATPAERQELNKIVARLKASARQK